VARRLVCDALATEPSIAVAGTASNGRLALAKLPQLNPDVVTLDVEMPEMDGLATLVELRKSYPHLPVIMFSAVTERGASATLDAIARGANDYVTKPVGAGGIEGARRHIAVELVPRIKAFSRRVHGPASEQGAPVAPLRRPSPLLNAAVEVLCIGVSTGGPNALAELIPALPAGLPVPVLVVQHMPPVFTRLLADRLDGCSALEVRECHGDEVLRPGFVYIARGDHHMRVHGSRAEVRLKLDQGPAENSCRPAVDVLFRSAAELFGGGVLAAVLTGMGQDGLRGCELVRERGGRVLAQDQATSVVWGMPGAVARAGLAERVVPLGAMASELMNCVNSKRATWWRKP